MLTFANGGRYEGQFKDGNSHGKGKMKYASGNSYTGDWVDGERTGHGAFTWSDGDQYEVRCSQISCVDICERRMIHLDVVGAMSE